VGGWWNGEEGGRWGEGGVRGVVDGWEAWEWEERADSVRGGWVKSVRGGWGGKVWKEVVG